MKPLVNTMLFRLTQHIREAQDPVMKTLGLTHGQPRVLRYVSQNEGCMQADVARYYHIKASTVSQIVDDLERNGFLRKRQAENCRRSASLSLTDKGKQCYEKLNTAQLGLQDKMLTGFSEEEKELFRKMIEQATENLKEVCDEAID